MFDLGKWFEERLADLNPFDNGRTAATVQAERAGRPAPAQTISAQPRQVVPAQTRSPINPGLQAKNFTVPFATPRLNRPKDDNPTLDAIKQTGQWAADTAKGVAENASKVANTAAFLPAVVGAKITGQNNNPEVQKQLSGMLERSFISPEIAGGKASVGDFAKGFTNAGVETSNLLPIKGAVTGLSSGLTQSAVKNSLMSNAKQAAVYGSAATGNDVLQGRDVTPGSVAANYAAPFAIGAGAEIAGGTVRSGFNATKSRVNEIQSQPGYNSQAGFAKIPQFSEPTKKLLGYPSKQPVKDAARLGREYTKQAETSTATTIRPIDQFKDFVSNNFTDDTAYFQKLDRQAAGRDMFGRVRSLPASERIDPQIQSFRNANSVIDQRIKDFGVEDFAKSFPNQKYYDAYQVYRANRAGLSRAMRERRPNETVDQAYARFTGGRNLAQDDSVVTGLRSDPFFDTQFAREREIYNAVLRERGANPNFRITSDEVEQIIKNDPDYAALNRILPEDKLTMQRQGAIGSMQGKNVKELAEGSQSLPIEDAVTSLKTYVGDLVKKDIGNDAMNVLLKNAPDKFKPVVTSEQLKAKKAAKVKLSELRSEESAVSREITKDRRALASVKSELQALDKATKGKATVYASPRQITARLAELTPDQAERIADNILRKNQELADLSGSIRNLSNRADQIRSERAGIMSDADLRAFKANAGENYRRRVRDGEEEIFEVTDARLAKNLSNLSNNQVSKAAQVLGVPTRVFRFFTTGTGNIIGFAPVAITRDILSTALFAKAPIRSTLDPRGIGRAFAAAFKKGDFFSELQRRGIGGTMVESERKASVRASDLMRKKGIAKAGYYAKNPREIFRAVENLDSATERATRARLASGRYQQSLARYKRQGLSPDEAKNKAFYDAAEEYREAALNFGRGGKVTKELGSVIAYLNPAVQAGNKVRRSFLESPLGTTFRVATIGSGIAGVWAWNNSSEERKKVWDSIDPKDKTENLIFVGPDASFDPATGKVTGVTKIPLPQEYRPLTSAVDQMYKETTQQDYGKVALNALTALGGIDVTSVNNTMSQLFPTSAKPLVENIANYSFFKNDKLTPDYIKENANGDKTLEVNNSSTGTATAISRATGGKFSPIEVDNVLNSVFGGATKDYISLSDAMLKNAGAISEDEAKSSTAFDRLRKRYTESYGESDAVKYFDTLESVRKTIKDPKDRQLFDALHTKTATPGLLDSATKYHTYLARPDIVAAERKLNDFNIKQGKPGNPLFDLDPEQMKKVLTYRSMRLANAAGQNRDKNNTTAYIALGLDEKWYDDFKDKEKMFFETVSKDKGESDEIRTFSGQKKPELSPDQKKVEDLYFSLPAKSSARKQLLESNSWLKAYWDESADFTNKEREALGFKPTVEKSFGGSGKGRGGRKKSGAFDYKLFGFDKGGASNSSNLYNLLKKTRAKKIKKPKKYTTKA